MKLLFIFLLLSPTVLFAHLSENPRLNCTTSAGEVFVMDEFQNDPCRIQRIFQGKTEFITNVSLCIVPDEVHSDFSFWWINPRESRSYYLGSLELENNSFVGSLVYSTETIPSGRAKLTCQFTSN